MKNKFFFLKRLRRSDSYKTGHLIFWIGREWISAKSTKLGRLAQGA